MNARGWIGSGALILAVLVAAGSLAAWKRGAIEESNAAAAQRPEPMEAVTVATAHERPHLRTTTAIGTVVALRSIALKNEIAGTVHRVALVPGEIVEPETVLVALDVSVEEAELRALEAQAALAETMLGRVQRASQNRGASESDVDRARAELDVARAQMERTKAIIARKTIRAPFRARVGMADVHPGQYLNEGTLLTTLQGVDDAVHVDFAVAQAVAQGLRQGQSVEVLASTRSRPVEASIVAIDARVDPQTRNAMVRARIEGASNAPSPGASVRVRVPVGTPIQAVVVPVNALRKGPGGDHVFVIAPDQAGTLRASIRNVESSAVLGDEVVILSGLAVGEQVAASGSFKLREGVLVAVADEAK